MVAHMIHAPSSWHGLPPAVVRMKARAERRQHWDRVNAGMAMLLDARRPEEIPQPSWVADLVGDSK